jgi:tRNA 5-methylaminomethyl-2-thiouridine biosynthesis bifunctional protein
MRTPLVPATPAFDANGTPWSSEYGDIYHSADSGPGQARHVFLGGNGLPARWANTRAFTILETGFGLGLNFLETWNAWRTDPSRPRRLHFVSIEKHPFSREGLALLHVRYSELATLAARLQSAWPLALPGSHRLEFEDGGITLTLVFGDAPEALSGLRFAADAIFLDGFAPDRNPEMWTPQLMRALARCVRRGATLATYTTARAVRDALNGAGFLTELRPGFGRKRNMLVASYAPRGTPRRGPPAAPTWSERRAIVVGAGLAGASVCERLAMRGWLVDLVERQPATAAEASSIPAGVFHPHVSRDDSMLSRLTRAAFLFSLQHWRALEAAGHAIEWQRCGVLQLAKDDRDEARMAATVRALGLPRDYADYLPRASATKQVGCRMSAGGWWFPQSGWMRPAALVTAQLNKARSATRLHVGVTVDSLSRNDGYWRALATDGTEIAAAPVVVLANSHDAGRLMPCGAPLKRVRGQLTRLPAGFIRLPGAVLSGAGHLIPDADGTAILGATYDFDDNNTEAREEDHAGNLERLERLLPGTSGNINAAGLDGAVGFRCVTADRLPLLGALPDGEAGAAGVQAREFPRLPGLYGAFAYASRGITWAALGGELLASTLEGEPLPVEGELVDAIDPARFLIRRARRRAG